MISKIFLCVYSVHRQQNHHIHSPTLQPHTSPHTRRCLPTVEHPIHHFSKVYFFSSYSSSAQSEDPRFRYTKIDFTAQNWIQKRHHTLDTIEKLKKFVSTILEEKRKNSWKKIPTLCPSITGAFFLGVFSGVIFFWSDQSIRWLTSTKKLIDLRVANLAGREFSCRTADRETHVSLGIMGT